MEKFFILAFFAFVLVHNSYAIFGAKVNRSEKQIRNYKFVAIISLVLAVLLSAEYFLNVFGEYEIFSLCVTLNLYALGGIYFYGWAWHRKKYYDSFEVGDLGIFYPKSLQKEGKTCVKGVFVKADGKKIKLHAFGIDDMCSLGCRYLMMLNVDVSDGEKFVTPVRELEVTMRVTADDIFRVYGVLLDGDLSLMPVEVQKDFLNEKIADADFLQILVSTEALEEKDVQKVHPLN